MLAHGRVVTDFALAAQKHAVEHLKLLRAAGLIETTQAGREMINTLRRDAFDQRFPGLLDAVLANRPA